MGNMYQATIRFVVSANDKMEAAKLLQQIWDNAELPEEFEFCYELSIEERPSD